MSEKVYRPNWHEYFMLLAKIVALRSGCNSRPTGAVIVKDKRILATGYNGPMPGAWHCTDKGSKYCFRREKGIPDIDKYNFCRSTHAEANAIAQAAKFGISVEGASIYCTLAPCYVCLKLLASAGIKEVYYEYDYESRDFERDEFWKNAIKEAGIKVFKQIRVSEKTLKALEKILSYPTSKRRLPPTT
ncbi:MAG: Deoxycytidylate deaminase [Thermodesulfobacterium sp.]|uniref:Deoxycytidylate deaminase n=1 Tax=Candidatus Thermodesulfobacterium syntrophicum TaxID=3060442 RepID=A0AAE3P4S9_9BACT|nr:Deoxycytidylate deaminase [Candidatus Thermodesulfobacterium syntrophicum]